MVVIGKGAGCPGLFASTHLHELSLADYLAHAFKVWYGYCLIMVLKLAGETF